MKATILTGNKKRMYHFKIWWQLTMDLFKTYKSPFTVFRITKKAYELKTKYTTEHIYSKLAYANGKVYVNCNNVGWPSKHFSQPVNVEARKLLGKKVSALENLRLVQIALTKKCPLNCEHCFEAEELNKKEVLTLEDHLQIVKKLQDAGVPIIQYSGGEPLTRIHDLVKILTSSKDSTDFWIFTSGFNLTLKNALKLKNAGLTGVQISLDHYLEEEHNTFRRNKNAYQWAVEATKNALQAGLIVSYSVCATKEFVTEYNLYQFAKLAQDKGVHFIHILEARSVGNYSDKNVSLLEDQKAILDRFFEEMNCSKKHKNKPIVVYPAYHQRRKGCPGSGSKGIFIDTNGYINACPFCRNKKTHFLSDDHELAINQLKTDGCFIATTI